MNVTVIGYGSIGRRHSRILNKLGCKMSIVSHQRVDSYPVYFTIKDAIQTENPDYIVIATPTNEHYKVLQEIRTAGYTGRILIEKPIFKEFTSLPESKLQNVFTGYNLRFHPVIMRMKESIQYETIVSAIVYAGQYLPEWRNEDYRKSYSSKRNMGGGVLRDLSHELDYTTWILGPWKELAAIGGHYSNLEIDSDDVFSILMTTDKCKVINIQINYLDRTHQRGFIINTKNHTYSGDLVRNTIRIDNQLENYPSDQDDTYRAEHIAMMNNDDSILCSAKDALETLYLIKSIEQSVNEKKWVAR